jgi:histidinol-phosphate aminotransferase
VDERRLENEHARETLARRLRELGLETIPSEANFLLVRVDTDDLALAEELVRRGLLIRPGHDFGMPGYIRATIGPVPVMNRLADELARVLEEDSEERLEGAGQA